MRDLLNLLSAGTIGISSSDVKYQGTRFGDQLPDGLR